MRFFIRGLCERMASLLTPRINEHSLVVNRESDRQHNRQSSGGISANTERYLIDVWKVSLTTLATPSCSFCDNMEGCSFSFSFIIRHFADLTKSLVQLAAYFSMLDRIFS